MSCARAAVRRHSVIEIALPPGHVCALPDPEAGYIAAESRKPSDPCSIVIFGASGDLTARKLIPALYHLFKDKQMPPDFRVIGFARREKSDDSFCAELRTALD